MKLGVARFERDRLAGDGDLLAQAIGYAGELAASAPLAVRAIRATLRLSSPV